MNLLALLFFIYLYVGLTRMVEFTTKLFRNSDDSVSLIDYLFIPLFFVGLWILWPATFCPPKPENLLKRNQIEP